MYRVEKGGPYQRYEGAQRVYERLISCEELTVNPLNTISIGHQNPSIGYLKTNQ
jgi:hypothetical protein